MSETLILTVASVPWSTLFGIWPTDHVRAIVSINSANASDTRKATYILTI